MKTQISNVDDRLGTAGNHYAVKQQEIVGSHRAVTGQRYADQCNISQVDTTMGFDITDKLIMTG